MAARDAIHREKRLKKWTRTWKINLIRTNNPDWKDLAAEWYPGGKKLPQMSGELGHPDALFRAPGDDGVRVRDERRN